MTIVDITILFIVLFFGLIGAKRGFTKALVSFIGLVLITILAYISKTPVSVFLYTHLPFFKFGGLIKGVTVLNILLYELIAFAIVFSILMIVLKILSRITSIFEKILTMTIVLGIPSKILGFVIGVVEGYIIAFFLIYTLNLPMINDNSYSLDGPVSSFVLNHSIVLSNISNDTFNLTEEFLELKDEYQNSDSKEFNQKTLDLFIKYKIIDKSTAQTLIKNKKLEGLSIN